MATIRRLRGKWQAQVRRKGIPPRAKSFDSKADGEKWARNLEAELDRCGNLPDMRLAEQMALRDLLLRYLDEITPHKRSASTEATGSSSSSNARSPKGAHRLMRQFGAL